MSSAGSMIAAQLTTSHRNLRGTGSIAVTQTRTAGCPRHFGSVFSPGHALIAACLRRGADKDGRRQPRRRGAQREGGLGQAHQIRGHGREAGGAGALLPRPHRLPHSGCALADAPAADCLLPLPMPCCLVDCLPHEGSAEWGALSNEVAPTHFRFGVFCHKDTTLLVSWAPRDFPMALASVRHQVLRSNSKAQQPGDHAGHKQMAAFELSASEPSASSQPMHLLQAWGTC